MPPIKCSNTFCDGRAEKVGGLCKSCEEQARKQQEREWLWKGFVKSTDNHRRGYKGGKP